ncbi:hypothetical protein OCH239_11515 [Roseivivax halodurans JCM 10272]|uniref:Uncharacterized protein n=1 Tax=Roseivivax halodurans JCM 10272 TaxID=1449350 RepID=X7EIU9_9RHOB|nr:DUF2793 domain-containing protein [Roseivivax halodurans]ETX15805.1 hypothetical protein OCH239_11515 [Roseivivax halodurans JCM 10272]
MPDTSPILSLPYLAPAQAQKHVTVNEALTRLDILACLTVRSLGAETPPASPQDGEVHALGPAPTGAWAGQPDMLAAFTGGAWLFLAPKPGWLAVEEATGALYVRGPGFWRAPPLGAAEIDRLGIGATADAGNPLTVRGPATLLTHDGAGHQLKVNKAGTTETASLLFQCAWSGRAEMGLAESDDWSIKVSADGSNWITALTFDAATGRAAGAAVQSAPDDAGPGKLMRADWGYGPGTLLGTVSESGGTPTGAAIETGNAATGSYTRLADGTQICRHAGFATASGAAATWTFPMAFSEPPAVTATPISAGAARLVTISNRSATAVDVSSFDASGSDAVSPSCDLVAIGRWF